MAFLWLRGDDFLARGAMLVLGKLLVLVRQLFLFICQSICFYLSLIIASILTSGLPRVFLVSVVQKIGPFAFGAASIFEGLCLRSVRMMLYAATMGTMGGYDDSKGSFQVLHHVLRVVSKGGIKEVWFPNDFAHRCVASGQVHSEDEGVHV